MGWIARSNCWEAAKRWKIALVWLSLWKSEAAGFNWLQQWKNPTSSGRLKWLKDRSHASARGCRCSSCSNSALVLWSRTLWQRHQDRWVFLSRKEKTTCSLCLSQYVAFYWKCTFYCKTRQLRAQINKPRCYNLIPSGSPVWIKSEDFIFVMSRQVARSLATQTASL